MTLGDIRMSEVTNESLRWPPPPADLPLALTHAADIASDAWLIPMGGVRVRLTQR